MDVAHNLLVCPKVVKSEHNLSSEVDLDALRNHLVYWDHIDVFSHSAAPVRSNQNLLYLQDVNCVSFQSVRLEFELQGGITKGFDDPPDINLQSYQAELAYELILAKAFEAQKNANKKIVSYDEPPWGFRVPPRVRKKSSTVQINIYNMLPRPSPNTPFEDIFRFKEKRRDELNSLRSSLHKLVREAQADPDATRGEFVAGQELQNALRMWQKAASESSFFSFRNDNLRISATIASAAAFAGAAQALNHLELFKIPLDFAVGVGAALPVLEGIIFRNAPVRSLSCDVFGFKYAHDVKRILQ